MTTHRILWKSEEFQICIVAASITLLHASVTFSVHYGSSQIHYSLKTVSKMFLSNLTTPSRKLYVHMISEQ